MCHCGALYTFQAPLLSQCTVVICTYSYKGYILEVKMSHPNALKEFNTQRKLIKETVVIFWGHLIKEELEHMTTGKICRKNIEDNERKFLMVFCQDMN